MKMLCKISVVMIFSGISYSCLASESVIEALSDCNASFFEKLERNKSLNIIPEQFFKIDIKEKKDFSLDVNHTSSEGVELNQFKVIYKNFDDYEEITPMDVKGKFYFWGFASNQPLHTIINALSGVLDLKKIGEKIYVYNPMIKSEGDEWSYNKSAVNGIAPAEKTTEKMFFIEETQSNQVTIMCSLQGNVSQKDLIDSGLLK
ncbi:hypothetical protein [Sodalis sp. RH16]|uniref:hypothetical protein n=1 Tax=unclassified Sodalis (in: enterobacteria) TaxID=2636512 RepID=UPI0039B41F21